MKNNTDRASTTQKNMYVKKIIINTMLIFMFARGSFSLNLFEYLTHVIFYDITYELTKS